MFLHILKVKVLLRIKAKNCDLSLFGFLFSFYFDLFSFYFNFLFILKFKIQFVALFDMTCI